MSDKYRAYAADAIDAMHECMEDLTIVIGRLKYADEHRDFLRNTRQTLQHAIDRVIQVYEFDPSDEVLND